MIFDRKKHYSARKIAVLSILILTLTLVSSCKTCNCPAYTISNEQLVISNLAFSRWPLAIGFFSSNYYFLASYK